MKNKSAKTLLSIIVIVLLAAFLIVPLFFANLDPGYVYTGRNLSAPVFYGITLLLSVVVLIVYVILFKRKYLWILLLFVSVIVVNAGYLAFSLASSVSEALLANRISYFGNVYMLLFLLLTIVNACGINYRKASIIFLFAVSSIMFLFSGTQGYLDLFYKNVDFAIVDGFSKLIKDYGPMHTVYTIYIFAYFIAIVISLIYSVKKKKVQSVSYIVALAIMGFINIAIWCAEHFVDNRIEYLSLSYIVNELVLLWIYYKLVQNNALDTFMIKMAFSSDDAPDRTINIYVSDTDRHTVLTNPGSGSVNFAGIPDEKLLEMINHLDNSEKLSGREKEVAVLLLKNLKRKDMASSLFISENTVKTHTSNIYGKLEVSSREELKDLLKPYADNELPKD